MQKAPDRHRFRRNYPTTRGRRAALAAARVRNRASDRLRFGRSPGLSEYRCISASPVPESSWPQVRPVHPSR